MEYSEELAARIHAFEAVLDAETIERRRRDAESPKGQLQFYLQKREKFADAVKNFTNPVEGKHKPPRCVWLKVNESFLIGQTPADKSKIYLAVWKVDDLPYGWFMKGWSAACFKFETTPQQQAVFDSLLPDWYDESAATEALEILEEKAFISFLPKKEYVEPMQVGRLGRYKNPAGGMREVWAANGRDAVACAIFEGQRRNNEKKMD